VLNVADHYHAAVWHPSAADVIIFRHAETSKLSLLSTEPKSKLSSAAISCERLHVCQSECSLRVFCCCQQNAAHMHGHHCWLTDACCEKCEHHFHFNILECDTVSFLNTANRRRWIFALECLLQLEILLLSVVPADRQHQLFNFHIYNDVLSDVTRNTNYMAYKWSTCYMLHGNI